MLPRLQTHLRRHNASYTHTRGLVFQAIAQIGPCTKQQVVKRLGGRVNAATVYRTIDLFLKLEVAHVVRYRLVELSDQFRNHHHHFICRLCGRESNFTDKRLESALERFVERRGLRLESHQIELSGICALCSTHSQP